MIERLESTRLPTSYGNFVLHAYNSPDIEGTHLALVLGDIGSATDPLVRIHSECLTGDLLKSLRCDCCESRKVRPASLS